jgi:Protein of unknown function (DUF3237)
MEFVSPILRATPQSVTQTPDPGAQIATHDGATIYVQYVGLMEMSPAAKAALRDATLETRFDDHYYRTTMRLECGDERYQWVNHTLFVARGRLLPSGVRYEVYRL